MVRRPPRPKLPDTFFPYLTRFRSFVGMLGTHRSDEFPDDAAGPGDLEDPPARRLGDQGVAVRQALLRPARLAFEGLLEAAGVAPDDAAVVGVDLQDAEIGRAHV